MLINWTYRSSHTSRYKLLLQQPCHEFGLPNNATSSSLLTSLTQVLSQRGVQASRFPFLQFTYNYTPYSKMAENTLLFCLIVNWPSLPRSHLRNSKEYLA